MQKRTKAQENKQTRRSMHKFRVRFGDDDDSQATSKEFQLDVIEEKPLQEMAEEMNGMHELLDSLQFRISAGGFRDAAKSPRILEDYQRKLVIRENCIGFDDDSNSETGDLSGTAAEEEQEQIEHQVDKIPFQEMAEEIRVMNATLDSIQARLSDDVLEEVAKLVSSIDEEMGLEPKDTRWLILHGSKDKEIRALQINSRRLRCQLADLVRCSELGATRLMAINRQTIRQTNRLRVYRKQYESVHSFYLAHQLEAGKCLMRYRHCLEVYCSWRELHEMGRRAQEAYDKILEITQSRGDFVALKKQVISDISQAHETIACSAHCLATRVKELGQALGIIKHSTPKAEPQKWQNYTGPPVVVKDIHWEGRHTYTLRFARGELFTIPVAVPLPSQTWYGRMRENLWRGQLPKIQDIVKCQK